MKPEYLTQIPQVFLELQTDYILFAILAIAIWVMARSYLKKAAELKAINDNFSTVIRQQSELKAETGRIQSILDKDHTDFRVKHEAYHEQSIRSIIEIYNALLKIREQTEILQLYRNLEKAQEFYDSVRNFRETLEQNRIWIAADIAELIENTAVKIESTTMQFIHSSNTVERSFERLTQAQIERLIEKQDSFHDLMIDSTSIFKELAAKIAEHYKSF